MGWVCCVGERLVVGWCVCVCVCVCVCGGVGGQGRNDGLK